MAKSQKSSQKTVQEVLEDLKKPSASLYTFIPDPTRYFEVGESVSYGNFPKARVLEVLNDGREYLIQKEDFSGLTVEELRQTTVPEHQRKEQFKMAPVMFQRVPWMFLASSRTEAFLENLVKFSGERLNFLNSISVTDLRELISLSYATGVDLSPEYQRGYVWTDDAKHQLIQSVFEDIEIGQFVFIKKSFESGQPGLELLDGKQRFQTLTAFYEDRFQFRGRYYSELHPKDQQFFNSSRVTYLQLPASLSKIQRYEVFLRVNTTGKTMDETHLTEVRLKLQELRAADGISSQKNCK